MKKQMFLLTAGLMMLCSTLVSADMTSDYREAKELFYNKKDYASCWQFARAAYRYGEYLVTSSEKQKAIFTEAKDAALKAVEASPQRPEAHYWLGVCYGAWAEANGPLNSLQYAKPIAEEMTKTISIEPKFNSGSPYMVRGRVYHKAPGWPLSVGDAVKADEDFKDALSVGPNNRKAYRFYADFLVANGRKKEAAAVIEKGLAIAYDNNDPLVEDREISLLKELKGKAGK